MVESLEPQAAQYELFDAVRLVSGEEVVIISVLGDGWFNVEFPASDEGCPNIEEVNVIEIESKA